MSTHDHSHHAHHHDGNGDGHDHHSAVRATGLIVPLMAAECGARKHATLRFEQVPLARGAGPEMA